MVQALGAHLQIARQIGAGQPIASLKQELSNDRRLRVGDEKPFSACHHDRRLEVGLVEERPAAASNIPTVVLAAQDRGDDEDEDGDGRVGPAQWHTNSAERCERNRGVSTCLLPALKLRTVTEALSEGDGVFRVLRGSDQNVLAAF